MSDLQAELETLRRENARLRKLLKLTDAEAAPARGTQAAWFDKAPGSVDARSSSQAKVEFYAALVGARRDVYAIRWDNTRTGKSGWMPAVEGGWRKGRRASDIRHLPLTTSSAIRAASDWVRATNSKLPLATDSRNATSAKVPTLASSR